MLVAALAMMTMMVPSASATVITNTSAGYNGPYFGESNFPPGCEGDMVQGTPEYWIVPGEGGLTGGSSSSQAVCHHMRTDMNRLDTPKIDVLILVPLTLQTERDQRLARQVIEMYEGGIQTLAPEMGLDWLSDGMEFHVTVDAIDPDGEDGGEFTTYPIWDPEIVVVMGVNPPATFGIGTTPVGINFCHGVQNPFDMGAWDALPGFDSHHDGRTGTYVEDCDGAGGDVCFSINTTFDTSPLAFDSMFDLVAHEVGHCMTIGHVGDGAEGAWGGLPPDDIMAYSEGGPGTKCLSTLDVEGIATVMSRYLDRNGDGVVDAADEVLANDQVGEGANPFQVQHPRDHFYASTTGEAVDCPQPDSGILPGARVDWTPEFQGRFNDTLTITGPVDGAINESGTFTVVGSVEHRQIQQQQPTETFAHVEDSASDATSPATNLLSLDVDQIDGNLVGVLALEQLWPTTEATSAVSYSLTVNGRQFDSFVRYPAVDANPMTWDNGAAAYLPSGSSTWDVEAGTVTFTIPRSYLTDNGVNAPYYVGSSANYGLLSTTLVDDTAPDAGETVGIAGAPTMALGLNSVAGNLSTVTFEREGGTTFTAADSTAGGDMLDTGHYFTLELGGPSDVDLHLEWTDTTGTTDLDLYVTGEGVDVSGGEFNALTGPFEDVSLDAVSGTLNLHVDPFLVTDAGVTYTLTAEVVELDLTDTDGDGVLDVNDRCPGTYGTATDGCVDSDGDGVADDLDRCPDLAGNGADGCPVGSGESVFVYVDGGLAGVQGVDTLNGPDTFAVTIDVAEGTHDVLIEWVGTGGVLVSHVLTVTHNTDDDGDGVVNADDQCPGFDDTIDVDGDTIPDDCDDLIDSDGDGVADDEDACHGFDDAIDSDGDGIPDDCDLQPNAAGDGQLQGDKDGDGVINMDDNCAGHANPDQSDIDGDGEGDVCDSDIDGDGHSNSREADFGTDPYDASSYPVKGVHYGPGS